VSAKRKAQGQLTPLELQIMVVLWDAGASSVQAVQERLASTTKLAYTTVQTMLNVLHRKGRVRRILRGRAYEYAPLLTRDRAERHAVRDMVDRLFGGSVDDLLMTLVRSEQIDRKDLERLGSLIDEHDRSERGGGRGND
jgi:BlaI family penicillinase repressor